MSVRRVEAKPSLSFWDSVAINIGVIIGVGIFRTPGEVAHYLHSSAGILIVWLVGAVIALFGCFCYASLSSRFPETGGNYVYLKEAYGRPVSFLFGWTEFFILRAGSIAMVAYVFTTYLKSFIPMGLWQERLATCAVIWIFTGVNLLGVKTSAKVQDLLSALKLLAILGIAAAIFIFQKNPAPFSLVPKGWGHLWLGVLPAMVPVMFSYGGWHQSTFLAGEFKDSKKALPLSLIVSIGILAAAYLLINYAYLYVLTPVEMAETKAIASDIFRGLFGPSGQLIITLVVLVSSSGALNSTILTGGVIPFSVAQDYRKLKWLAVSNERVGAPIRSILLMSAWATVLVLWGSFAEVLFYYAFANWLFFALVGASLFIFERRSKTPAPFPLIGYPLTPILFIFSAVAMCIITVMSAPRESGFGALMLLSGFLVYLAVRGKKGTL